MANFLLIDTSTSMATVSIGNTHHILALERLSEKGKQAESINLMIENVLNLSALTLSQIDGIGICAGPGSYTGLRIGMSTAKGIAFALQKPLICFDRLQLIALSYQKIRQSEELKGILLTARKEEYFWALFSPKGQIIEAPVHIFKSQIIKVIKPEYLIISDVPDLSIDNKIINLPVDFHLDMEVWLKQMIEQFEKKSFSDLAYVEPYYLKAAFTTTPKKKIL